MISHVSQCTKQDQQKESVRHPFTSNTYHKYWLLVDCCCRVLQLNSGHHKADSHIGLSFSNVLLWCSEKQRINMQKEGTQSWAPVWAHMEPWCNDLGHGGCFLEDRGHQLYWTQPDSDSF